MALPYKTMAVARPNGKGVTIRAAVGRDASSRRTLWRGKALWSGQNRSLRTGRGSAANREREKTPHRKPM